MVLAATVLGMLFSRERWRLPARLEVLLLAFLLLWMGLSTLQALFPDPAALQWSTVWRIQLGILLTLMLTRTRAQIEVLVWTSAVSLGFYGVKGGLWTLLHGGVNRVYGPPGGFIGGNNEIGLALLMTAPLIWYLAQQATRRWVRYTLYAAALLTLVAVVGTHSRGAFLGLLVMGLMMFIKARRRLLPALLALVFVLALPLFAPQSWFDRMHTIGSYQGDSSAMGRIDSWHKAVQIAGERLTGGGFEVLVWSSAHDAHSIYFEVLAEHGYPGLLLFLALIVLAWRRASGIRRRCAQDPARARDGELAAMLQVSLAGYLSAGAFLGLAYFDFFYLLLALLLCLDEQVLPLARASRVIPRHAARPLPSPG
jgi:probable O-glycosylation ligase (exosortase A-associated)